MQRNSRKVEHIEHFLKTYPQKSPSGFADIHLVHNALADYNLAEINLETKLAGLQLEIPIFLNAITGGDEKVKEINRKLASCAKKYNLAMAVGSQNAALKNPAVVSTFTIVREQNPAGIIFANLGAYAQVEEAQRVVEMIAANALQLHLNLAQELCMSEGDRFFKGYLTNIEKIVRAVKVPVIVKETGCGISFPVAQQLLQSGVQIIDTSGCGGSNFLAIEASRAKTALPEDFSSWGLPSAVSLLETVAAAKGQAAIIASGGISTPLEAVKALSVGANAVGMAGHWLEILLKADEDFLGSQIEQFILGCKKIMLLTGSKNLKELRQNPVVLTGFVKEWLEAREIAWPRAKAGT